MSLDITRCAAVGSDVQCHVDRVETSYCAGPTRDITDSADWISSNPGIAIFNAAGTPSGYLKVLADGRVDISSRVGFLTSPPQTFNVSPASVPQQDLQLQVSVVDDQTNRRVSSARVEIRPVQSTSQICETDLDGSCRFRIRMIVGGTTDVIVSARGYLNAFRTVPYCLNCEFVLRLTPVQS